MKTSATKKLDEGKVPTRAAAPPARNAMRMGAGMTPGASFANVSVLPKADGSGTTPDGQPCDRDWSIRGDAGRATWSGMTQSWLDKHVRVLTEDDKNIEHAKAGGSSDAIEAVYYGRRMAYYILKVPDHCTVDFNGFLSTSPYACCNNAGKIFASLTGSPEYPRQGSETEFGVPNDWDKPPEGGKK